MSTKTGFIRILPEFVKTTKENRRVGPVFFRFLPDFTSTGEGSVL